MWQTMFIEMQGNGNMLYMFSDMTEVYCRYHHTRIMEMRREVSIYSQQNI